MIGNNDRMDDATIVSRREPEHIGLLRWRGDTIRFAAKAAQAGGTIGRRDYQKTGLSKDDQ